jgi:purine-binding chemotaxis protein CheW
LQLLKNSFGRENMKKGESENRISDADLGQYVTFLIGDELYGVEVLKVQEIIGMIQITYVPNAPSFMKGVINLRGAVVPVVDMRSKFAMSEREYDSYTVIIISEVRNRPIGMIVDSVSDVAGIPVDSIQDTPHFAAKVDSDFIKGIGQIDGRLVIILDVDRILTSEEADKLEMKDTESA